MKPWMLFFRPLLRKQHPMTSSLSRSGITKGGGQWGQLPPTPSREPWAALHIAIAQFYGSRDTDTHFVIVIEPLTLTVNSGCCFAPVFTYCSRKKHAGDRKQNFVMLSPEGLFLAQNAPKIVCRPGSARTRWGSLQRSPDPLAGFKGPTSKDGGGEGWGGEGWKFHWSLHEKKKTNHFLHRLLDKNTRRSDHRQKRNKKMNRD